ncbi:unnamed protein product [Moneuplotes crassus]|uniref:Uncharacterized protein n=1 Tax=Euplotes crassus TaxID=5936 RepID=A0AAD2D7P5_EUPCR|nr:unnamed protein product [Moneuplotes crassus]
MLPRSDILDFDDETNDDTITNRASIRRSRGSKSSKQEEHIRSEMKHLLCKGFELNLVVLSYVGSRIATELCKKAYLQFFES